MDTGDDLIGVLGADGMAEVEEVASKITPEQLNEALSRLIVREVELLRDQRFSEDPEMREITLWNIASLVAASERLIPEQPEAGPDGP